MRPSELFGVAVRSMGIWHIATAVIQAMNIAILPAETWGQSLAVAAIRGGVGLILFFSANGFVQTAYERAEIRASA